MNNNRTCPECGSRLIGRADKKFCSDMCRSTHNNRLAAFKNNTIRNINNTLKRNRRILDERCPAAEARVLRKTLAGFDFSYFTHLRKTRKGNTCYCVYDLGYQEIGNGIILIVRG
ncbi:MAG: hypothetical protein LRY55_13670 [Leadbetterella sp.]|nr:hypothetical protein [Leadbetterella sp.]